MWRSFYISPGRKSGLSTIHYNQCDYRVHHWRFTRLLPLSVIYLTRPELQVELRKMNKTMRLDTPRTSSLSLSLAQSHQPDLELSLTNLISLSPHLELSLYHFELSLYHFELWLRFSRGRLQWSDVLNEKSCEEWRDCVNESVNDNDWMQ